MPNRPELETVLIVGSDRSYCGHCGWDADNRETTHRRIPGNSSGGCGARFTTIRPDQPFPNAVLRQTLAAMRPDLNAAI